MKGPDEAAKVDPHRREEDGAERDVNRTGAKPVAGEAKDTQEGGAGFHTIGSLRTKSGRSDTLPDNQTLSMSCSDKIARWAVTGLQGALLSLFLERPLFFASVVAGGAAGTEVDAMRRALQTRIAAVRPAPVRLSVCDEPSFAHTEGAVAARLQSGRRLSVCGWSLVWDGSTPTDSETLVGAIGRRQGASSKLGAPHPAKGWSRLCRATFFRSFHALLAKHGAAGLGAATEQLHAASYQECKRLANAYQRAKLELLGDGAVFQNWSKKPAALQDFRLEVGQPGTTRAATQMQ